MKSAISNKEWATPSRAQLLVEKIDGWNVQGFRLAVVNTRPVRPRVGWLYLTVALRDSRGALSRSPVLTGIVSGGGRGVQPWLECRFYPTVEFDNGAVDARSLEIEAAVIARLGQLVPPGGHIMIDYETGGQEETFAELVLQVPPAATYLGALMLRAGFRGEFKDWYFSEGGHEGPRKLQGNKPSNPASARRSLQAHLRALRSFIRSRLPPRRADAEIVARARRRAQMLIEELGHQPAAASGARVAGC